MSQPFVGEIRIFGGNFAPAGWMFCDGQLLPIADYDTLFNLIGTTYGGDGQSTFALPDLRGRVPMHQGNGHVIAETGGVETVTLTAQQIPVHNHQLLAGGDVANAQHASGNTLGDGAAGLAQYHGGSGPAAMSAQSLTAAGGSQPHNNIQPYLALSFIISMFGVFPSVT